MVKSFFELRFSCFAFHNIRLACSFLHCCNFVFYSSGTNSKPKKVSFFRKLSRAKEQSPAPAVTMQQPPLEMALRELTHPTHNEQLKNQQQVTFKLVKTGKLSHDTFA